MKLRKGIIGQLSLKLIITWKAPIHLLSIHHFLHLIINWLIIIIRMPFIKSLIILRKLVLLILKYIYFLWTIFLIERLFHIIYPNFILSIGIILLKIILFVMRRWKFFLDLLWILNVICLFVFYILISCRNLSKCRFLIELIIL